MSLFNPQISPLGMRPKLHVRQRAGKRDSSVDGKFTSRTIAPIGEPPLEVSPSFALIIPLYSDDAENLAYGEKVHSTANTGGEALRRVKTVKVTDILRPFGGSRWAGVCQSCGCRIGGGAHGSHGK